MMEGGGSDRGGSGCDLAGSSGHCNFRPRSPSSFFSISFSRLVKNFTKRNFIFPFYPTPVFARHGTAGLLYPGSSSNTYVHITFSFCLQKSGVSDTMEDRINCLCVGKRLQKYLHGRMKKSGYKNVYIGESFFAYAGNGILRPRARCTKQFCIFCIRYLIVIYYI